jgi:hypothetical protein
MYSDRGHRSTTKHRDRGSAQRGRSRQRSAALGVGLLIAAACGGSDDDASSEAEAAVPETEPATTETPIPTEVTETTAPVTSEPEPSEPDSTEPAPETTETGDADAQPDATVAGDDVGPLPGAEWARKMIEAWDAYLTSRFEVSASAEADRLQGDHFFDVTHAVAAAGADVLDDYAIALDTHADDPALDASADPLRDVVDEMAVSARTVAELSEQDPDRTRRQIDDVSSTDPGSLPDTPWGDAVIAFNNDELSARLDAACFDLQDAISAAGHGLVDCAGSSIDVPPIGDVLQPGVHELTGFSPGLTLELTRPAVVLEASDFVEVSQLDGSASADFVDVDEVVDPSRLADPGSDATTPIPEDLGPWLAQFPLTVLAEGTLETGTGPAPYWDLQVDGGRMAEMMSGEIFLQLATYAENESFGSFKFFGGPPVPEQHFILVDWGRDDDRLLVYSIGEQGDPLLEWTRTMLDAAS